MSCLIDNRVCIKGEKTNSTVKTLIRYVILKSLKSFDGVFLVLFEEISGFMSRVISKNLSILLLNGYRFQIFV